MKKAKEYSALLGPRSLAPSSSGVEKSNNGSQKEEGVEAVVLVTFFS